MATVKKSTGCFSWKNFLIYGVLWLVIFMVGSGIVGCVRATYIQIQKINAIMDKFGDGGTNILPFQTAEEQSSSANG